MRRRVLLPVLLAVALLPGCGDDDRRDLRSDRLTVVDWGAAAPRALCRTEQEARAEQGRTALRTADAPAGGECWVAIRTVAPIATGVDVEDVVATDDGREELRFSAAVRRRLLALGTDAHVGVVYDGRLLDVVFPKDGRVRVPG